MVDIKGWFIYRQWTVLND